MFKFDFCLDFLLIIMFLFEFWQAALLCGVGAENGKTYFLLFV